MLLLPWLLLLLLLLTSLCCCLDLSQFQKDPSMIKGIPNAINSTFVYIHHYIYQCVLLWEGTRLIWERLGYLLLIRRGDLVKTPSMICTNEVMIWIVDSSSGDYKSVQRDNVWSKTISVFNIMSKMNWRYILVYITTNDLMKTTGLSLEKVRMLIFINHRKNYKCVFWEFK